MKKSLTFSFAMLLGVVVLLSPVSNALEADMSMISGNSRSMGIEVVD